MKYSIPAPRKTSLASNFNFKSVKNTKIGANMPVLTEEPVVALMRTLLYGPAKTKKTWWVLRAAECGYNVILMDGDDGHHIASKIDAKYRKHIGLIHSVDRFKDSNFADITTAVMSDKKFVWNADTKKVLDVVAKGKLKGGEELVTINSRKLTAKDILVIDSWSALCDSIALSYNVANKINPADAAKTEWDGYGYGGRLLQYVLTNLKSLPCHVVVIGHAQLNETKQGGEVVSSKTQVKSFSKPHSEHLSKHFSDILYFTQQGTNSFKIATGRATNRDGGCRTVAPDTHDWDKFTFKKYLENQNMPIHPITEFDTEGCVFSINDVANSKPATDKPTADKPKLILKK